MKPNTFRHETKTIDYLNKSFASAAKQMSDRLGTRDNSRGTVLHRYQTEFCYCIDSIQRDSSYMATEAVRKANELISNMTKELV